MAQSPPEPRPARPSSGQADRDFVARAARWGIVVGVALAVGLGLLWLLKTALTPLAAAFVIAYLLDPLIDRFEARRVRRPLAIRVLLLLVGGGLSALVLLVVPRLQGEVAALAERMPAYLDHLVTVLISTLERHLGVTLRHTLEDLVARVRAGEIPLPLDAIRDLLHLDSAAPPSLRGREGVCQNLEGFVLTPRIAGQSVGLHPAAVIVALRMGGDLFGFLGLLIAVPAAAVVKVFVAELATFYRRSALYEEGEPGEDAGARATETIAGRRP